MKKKTYRNMLVITTCIGIACLLLLTPYSHEIIRGTIQEINQKERVTILTLDSLTEKIVLFEESSQEYKKGDEVVVRVRKDIYEGKPQLIAYTLSKS